MNALVCRAAEKKKQRASSSGAVNDPLQGEAEGQRVTIVEPASEASRGTSSRKRRASEILHSEVPFVGSPEIGEVATEAQPLRQVRLEHIRVNRCRTGLLELYHDDLRIVGVPLSPLGGSVLRDLPSRSDAEYIQNLSWTELNHRSNSASAEAALLNAEVTFRANNYRKQFNKDSRAFEKTSADLEKKIADLITLQEKEVANAKRREEDMRLGFEAELRKLKNELRVTEVRLGACEEKLKSTEEELALSRLDLDSTRAEAARGAENFRETFLKSDEFGDIVGEKALGFLNTGFDGCVEQFRAAGYPPEGVSSDFLDVDKVLENLPSDV